MYLKKNRQNGGFLVDFTNLLLGNLFEFESVRLSFFTKICLLPGLILSVVTLKESDLALIAVFGRGMKSARGTAGRIFAALAHANVNVKMIDQGSSELNIIIGVRNEDFEIAIKAIYDIFVSSRL